MTFTRGNALKMATFYRNWSSSESDLNPGAFHNEVPTSQAKIKQTLQTFGGVHQENWQNSEQPSRASRAIPVFIWTLPHQKELW